eukprot:GHVQ01017621.1.p1 GENE.GHVQ01017621.1~~GHVQ01017621.1.p1  ORF type:complete len:205 (+),score=23.43 GHVQ01017621.1:296-910(+)
MTFGTVLLFTLSDGPRQFIQANVWILYACLFMWITTLIALSCCSGVARNYPGNYICLFLFTACQSLLLGVTSAALDTWVVLMAVSMTLIITVALILFASQARIDFTGLGSYLLVGLIALIVFGLFSVFIPSPFATKLYALLGTVLFSLYIVYDTQKIIGGRHRKHQFGLDDYVFAALALYIDIVHVFLYFTTLLSSISSSSSSS